MTAPRPIPAGAPGTFAYDVFRARHPKLVDQLIAALPYEPAQQTAIRLLLDESITGVLTPLTEGTPDHAQWLDWGEDYWGRPWGEAPFLWAESYWYRRLLEATGYFRPGPWRGVDPFAPTKNADLASDAATEELRALGELSNIGEDKLRDALLVSSLWGNQADLSFQLTTAQTHNKNILIDHSAELWATLAEATNATVCLIADNSGRELLPDLILIDHLLTTRLAASVTLYLKPWPYYVSDATMTDLLAALERLQHAPIPEARDIEQRLRLAISGQRLHIRTHDFFCAPQPYHDLPTDLASEFATATTTILKGDLNYRRLVGDQHWAPTASFTDLVNYFPSPVIALRALKSEVIVGLTPTQVDHLDTTGRAWRTTGEYAVIQSN